MAKKVNEMQKKQSELLQLNKEMESKLAQSEAEKSRLNEKWVRLAARVKLEERSKSQGRGAEISNEVLTKEVDLIKRKTELLEKENKYLKDQNRGLS